MTSPAPFWTVAAVQTNRADHVVELLDRDGFETYLPKVRETRKRTAPLFPGYVMVRIVLQWHRVRWTPGVLRLLMDGERPARLSDVYVEQLQAREVKGFIRLPRDPKLPVDGDTVRILTGTFAGHLAIYRGMDGKARERVLLQWLGRAVPLIMPVGNVERV